MPEVQEVFHMATQKVRPDPNALERQHRTQQRHVARQKAAVFVLVGALVIVGAVFGIRTLRDNSGDTGIPAGRGTASPIPSLPAGELEPGRYVLSTLDPDFDASHRIMIEVPDGYVSLQQGQAGWAAVKPGSQTGLGAWRVGDVYADACKWKGTADSQISSVDDLVAALASQRGLRVSTPMDTRVDGFAGKYIERTVRAGINVADCDEAEFRVWSDTAGGYRFLGRGQLDLLWILDVDGVPLVIDASLSAGATAQDRAELLQMVESIRIDPR